MSHALINRIDSKLERLRDRAAQLRCARDFFEARGVLEVDTPLLRATACVDAHIDLIEAYDGARRCFLHSSPEYCMKRLLAEGIGDIYQLSHVFRAGEHGARHQPEFLMAEWYRIGFSFTEMIEETLAFIQLFLGELSSERLSYRDAFQKYLGIDVMALSFEEMQAVLLERDVTLSPDLLEEGVEGLRTLLLGLYVEPELGREGLTVLYGYPPAQAALAKTASLQDEEVALRFEVYYRGIELANGYCELADPREQRRRLEEANDKREQLGKGRLPLDEHFLEALERGLPECCGVAVGVDRLMLLRWDAKNLEEVLPFGWEEASH